MSTETRNKHVSCRCFVSVFALCVCVGCSGDSSGYDSPQEAFDAVQTAYRARQWATVYDALTPESQQMDVAMRLVVCRGAADQLTFLKKMAETKPSDRATQMIAESQASYDKYAKVLDDHKVSLDDIPESVDMQSEEWSQTVPKLAALVADPKKFHIDFQEQTKTFKASTEPPKESQKLKNLTIEGDTARADVEDGLLGNERAEFRRINGRWFMHLAAPKTE